MEGLSSKGTSAEEGRVDVELNRASDEELSFWPPLEAEFWVPPLPLSFLLECYSIQFWNEHWNVPVKGSFSRCSIDEDVIFSELPFA